MLEAGNTGNVRKTSERIEVEKIGGDNGCDATPERGWEPTREAISMSMCR